MNIFMFLVLALFSANALASADTECTAKGFSLSASSPGSADITIGAGSKARTLPVKYFNADGPFLVWVTEDGSYLKRLNVTEIGDGVEEKDLESKELGILFDAKTGKTISSFLQCD